MPKKTGRFLRSKAAAWKIVEKNQGLVGWGAKRLLARWPSLSKYHQFDDVKSQLQEELWMAARQWNPKKGTLPTYFLTRLPWAAGKLYTKTGVIRNKSRAALQKGRVIPTVSLDA